MLTGQKPVLKPPSELLAHPHVRLGVLQTKMIVPFIKNKKNEVKEDKLYL